MSAVSTTRTSPATSLPTFVVFRRAVAAELTKLWTVRSTYWSLLVTTAMVLLVSLAFGLEISEPTPVWVAGEITIMFAQFGLLIPAMLAVSSEYSTGAIRTTLQGVPRRGVMGLARLAVTVATTVALATLLMLVAAVASGLALGDNAELVVGDLVGSIGSIALIVGVGTIVTVGLATFLRNAAGTLATIFLVLLVLPVMLPGFGVEWLTTIGENMPGAATMSLLEAYGMPLISTGHAIAVLVAWAVGATALSAWSLFRRDAG